MEGIENMKLKDAIEIAEDCGLETVGEAVLNIRIHSLNLFEYGKELEEYKELIDECWKYGLESETEISYAKNLLNQN